MPRSNIAKVNIVINQDWSKIISIYKTVLQRWYEDKLPEETYLEEIDTYHYDLGNLGSLTSLDTITLEEKQASLLHGKILENKLPWAKKLREDLADLNLSSFCMFHAKQNVSKHRDYNGNIDQRQDICKINFFIETSDSVIHIGDDEFVESIPAVANTGWLMDVSYPHWTTSPNGLFTFQLCFYKPFDQVLEWFNKHPDLVYGE